LSRPGLRIDKWLWHARLVKSRSLAAQLCTAGLVELAGNAVARAAQPVHIGDLVRLTHGGRCRTVEVTAYGARRGPTAEAQLLYRIVEETVVTRADPEWVNLIDAAEDDEAS
jgi:ribosome-associated heat shock protein Hsp15